METGHAQFVNRRGLLVLWELHWNACKAKQYLHLDTLRALVTFRGGTVLQVYCYTSVFTNCLTNYFMIL